VTPTTKTATPTAKSRFISSSSSSFFGAGLVVLLIVIVAWISRSSEGKKSLDACDAAVKRGDRIEAIVFARAAAESRCPLCSSSETGYQRLQTIAKEAEGRGEDTTAVAAWRAVRAASLSSVVIDTQTARRTHADEEIARLEHRIDLAAAAGGGSTTSPAASEERLRVALQASSVPGTMVFLMLTAGGVLFFVAAYRFVRRRSSMNLVLPDVITAVIGIGVALAGLLLF
jgi:hypothetical protein